MRKPWLIIVVVLVAFIGYIAFKQTSKEEKTSEITPTPTPVIQEEASPIVPLPVSEARINEQLKSYLPKIGQPAYSGQVFCAHHLYGFDEDQKNNLVKAYVWAYCEEYYQESGQLKMGFGVSEPVLVTMELKNGVLTAKSYKEPGNGSLYAPSIKEMFPENYATEAIVGYPVDQLKPSPQEQAEAYYDE